MALLSFTLKDVPLTLGAGRDPVLPEPSLCLALSLALVLSPSAWSSLPFRFLTLPENKACPAQLTGPFYGSDSKAVKSLGELVKLLPNKPSTQPSRLSAGNVGAQRYG